MSRFPAQSAHLAAGTNDADLPGPATICGRWFHEEFLRASYRSNPFGWQRFEQTDAKGRGISDQRVKFPEELTELVDNGLFRLCILQ